MAVANNADDYAASRQNIWFTANNQTNADGNLTGQCVTLDKWFFAEMTSIPSPFAARGNAKDVGRTLVAQGHAVEVPYAQRRRGDIICYEYGTYGHTAVQLSGGRVFESNVNWSGVATKLDSTGERVYASRIGNENEAWRATKNPHIYRLKTYSEGGSMSKDAMTREELQVLHNLAIFQDGGPNWLAAYEGKSFLQAAASLQESAGNSYRKEVADRYRGNWKGTKEQVTKVHRLALLDEPGVNWLAWAQGHPFDEVADSLRNDPPFKNSYRQKVEDRFNQVPPPAPISKEVVVKYLQDNLK